MKFRLEILSNPVLPRTGRFINPWASPTGTLRACRHNKLLEQMVPGHYNLRNLAEFVKKGIHRAGGMALEFGVIGARRAGLRTYRHSASSPPGILSPVT